MRGKIIAFEGTDGSGKETQSKLLVEKLKHIGIPAKYISFPEYGTPHAKPVEDYLQGVYGEVGNLSPLQVSTLYAFDRSVSVKEHHLKEELENGTWFIIDRYTESNVLFQTAMIDNSFEKQIAIRNIYMLENCILDIPPADLVIFLHLPTEFSVELIKQREGKTDIHESNFNFLKKVEKNALELAGMTLSGSGNIMLNLTSAGRWNVINCISNDKIRTIDDISKEVFEITLNNAVLKGNQP